MFPKAQRALMDLPNNTGTDGAHQAFLRPAREKAVLAMLLRVGLPLRDLPLRDLHLRDLPLRVGQFSVGLSVGLPLRVELIVGLSVGLPLRELPLRAPNRADNTLANLSSESVAGFRTEP